MTRTLPGLGLTGFWPLGFDGWKDAMDDNLRRLSALVQPSAISRTTELPASPTAGDIYIVPAGAAQNANDIALYDGPSGSEAWVYLTPQEGWSVYVRDTDEQVRFDGTAWQAVASGGGSAPSTTVTQKSASYSVTNADLAGAQYHETTGATAITVTVPSGLTGTEPLVIERGGSGSVTFAAGAGVTINSRDGNLAIGGQHGAVTLIPKGSDVYTLIGDLSA